jgi:putative nucleotidyltransferase with HDIG domain
MTDTRRILEGVGELAPLPATAVRLMQIINDPHADMGEILEAIRYDAVVTGALLRICNSAFAGVSRKITSIDDAVVYLGTAKVLRLVMSVHAKAALERPQEGYGLDPGVLWRSSVATASASAVVAQRVGLPHTGLAFTAGLLHDIGKVVLNEYVAEEFREIIERVKIDKVSFEQAERAVLGYSHDEIGAIVAERWQLPEPIVQCVRYHHRPSRLEPPEPLVDTVYLGDCICMLLGIGLGDDGLSYRADAAVMQRHRLQETDLEQMAVDVLAETTRIEQMFGDALQTAETRAAR